MDWWDQGQQPGGDNYWNRPAVDNTPEPQSSSFFGGLLHGAEHAAGNVGHFFGGIVKGVADVIPQAYNDAVETGKTLRDLVLSPVKEHNANNIINQVNDLNKQWRDKTTNWTQADYQDPENMAAAKAHFAQMKALGSQAQGLISSDTISHRDAVKSGLAAFNTVINVGTLGDAGVIEGGLKVGAKVGIPGAEAVAKNLAEKSAAKAAAPEIINRTVSGAAKNIGKEALPGTLLGGVTGASNEMAQNPTATPGEIARSALFGGALGGLPDVIKGGVKHVRAGAESTPEAARLAEAGTPNEPPPTALETASSNAEHARQQLNGEPIQSAQPDIAQQVASEYHSPDEYITERAKQALGQEKTSQGGAMVPGKEGGYVRTSDHAPWYRDYYASTGRAPSLAATKDIVEGGLKSGKGVSGAVLPEESNVYNILKDREAGLQHTAQEGPPPELSAQYMDSLAGKPQGAQLPPQRTLRLGKTKGKLQIGPDVPAPPAGEQFPANQRGFFGNLQTAKTITSEGKQTIAKIEPQTHDVYSNPEAMMAGRNIIGDNPEKAYTRIISADNLSTEEEAAGMQLLKQYDQGRQFDKMAAIADKLDVSGREHGRGGQIFAAIDRMSPDGVVYYAAKKIGQGREKISSGRGFEKGIGGEQKTIQAIQGELEKAGQVSNKTTRKAVRDAVKSSEKAAGEKPVPAPKAAKEAPTTAEKIASNVEKMATPAQKKKADVLVKEITKKVKQEMLDNAGKAQKRSPLDVMREVFARNGEAQDAFPEAQRILLEKAKDNPAMQTVLQKFFDSELGHPVAGSTFNAAIKEQMIKNESKISDIISKSWNGQKQSIDQVASELTKEGFDQNSARVIAKEVTDRLKAQTVVAKQNALNRLARDVPKRQKTLFLDKVNKLSNLGALDSHDYLELARAKLKLPQLSEETAKTISGLAQKMQDLPVGAERDAVGRQIYSTINDSIPKTLGQKAAEVVSAPKAIMASYDLSGTLRQGGVLGSRFRKEARAAFGKQLSYFKSSDAYDKGMSAIRHDPLYEAASRGGVALTGVEGGEEAFASQLPEHIPILGKGIQASDRAYTGTLTELRFGAFKHIAQDLKNSGIDINTFSDEQLKSIGKFINTASGRGYGKPGGLFEKMAPALNRTLFSPRLWKSRLDMLNPVYYAKLDPVARKYALQSAGDFAAIAASVLGLASLMGAKVETDPRSSDFLKVRFGDTRYDILGGFQQNLVFAARELTGEKKSSTTGTVSSLTSGKFGSTNRLSILGDLIQNKENPVIAAGSDILRGTDQQGKPTSLTGTIGSLAIPLNIQDTYSIAKQSNPLQALLTGTLPGTIGVGVNTYPSPDDSVYKKYADALAGK